MSVKEVQWSELQRDPREVARLADSGVVRVRRRDGAPLLLIREEQQQAVSSGTVTAARALRNVMAHLSPDVAQLAITDEFPWTDTLPESDRRQFVSDFVRAFLAAAELGSWEVLDRTVKEWQNTAAIYSDPELSARLSRPISDDLGPVPNPIGQ